MSRGAERNVLGEVEADGDRGELSLVADRKRGDGSSRPFREGADRHHLTGRGRTDVDLVERGGIAEKRRQHLLDHVIGIHLGEVLGDLPLTERVIEGVVDELRLDSVARGHVAVDLERQGRAGVLLIGRDVAQLGQRL